MIVLLLAFAFVSCVPSKKVVRKGVLMPEDQAARMDYADAENLQKARKYKDALTVYDTISEKYPTQEFAAKALFKSSRIYIRQKKYGPAKARLEKLVMNFPLSSIIHEARLDLAKIYFREKKYDDSKDSLLAVNLDRFPEQKRLKILLLTRRVLKLTESWPELIKYNIKIYDKSTDFAELAIIKKEVFDIIDTELNSQKLKKLADDRKGRYPGDLALWKLAKLTYHKGNSRDARSYLVSFLRNYPLSEYYSEADALYNLLTKRKSPNTKLIGVLLPLSGPNAIVGEIALKGIWEATGLFSKGSGKYDNFKIIVRDTQGNADAAARAFDELVLEKGVIGIIGPMLAKTSEVAALKAQQYGVPVILLNQNENIVEIGNFVFRNFISKNLQARTLAKFTVEKLGIRRFAFLYPLHKYGRSFVSAFWDELEKYDGVEIRGVQSYEPTSNDFSKPIKKLVGLDNLSLRRDEICKEGQEPAKKNIFHRI